MRNLQMTCKTCDETWDMPRSMRTTFKEEGVQRWDDKGNRCDLCPKCGCKGEDVDDGRPVSAPGLSFTDSGTGKTVVK